MNLKYKTEYIKEGRFEHPTIWINDFKPLLEYPGYMALNVGQALDLWASLSTGLSKAGQLGTIHAGIQELMKQEVSANG